MRYHKGRTPTAQGAHATASREASMETIPKRRTATLVLALSAAMTSIGYMAVKAETRIPMNEDGTEQIKFDPQVNTTRTLHPAQTGTPNVRKAPTHTTGAEKRIALDEEGIELSAPTMVGEAQSNESMLKTTRTGDETEEGKTTLNEVSPDGQQIEEAPRKLGEEDEELYLSLPIEIASETPDDGETPREGTATVAATRTKNCDLTAERERAAIAGDRLVKTITRWAGRDGWRVVAKTRYDWPIEAGHTSNGPLDQAVLEITEAYKAVQPAPKVTAYGRNCVIVIRDNAARSG